MTPATRSSRGRPGGEIRYYRTGLRSYAPLFALAAAAALALAAANVAVARGLFAGDPASSAAVRGAAAPSAGAKRLVAQSHEVSSPSARARTRAGATRARTAARASTPPAVGAINPKVPGLTTFRGNLTRSYYGEGPVPRRSPRILWRYPAAAACARSPPTRAAPPRGAASAGPASRT